jgi:hypothetical protein
MNRRLPMLLLAAATTLTSPAVSHAACASDLPVSDRRAASVTCTGVHAGMAVMVPSMKYDDEVMCAASFAFRDQYGQRYLAIPGTCFLDFDCLEDVITEELPPPLNQVAPALPVCVMPSDSELEPVYKRNGPAIKDIDGKRVGAIVYAVNKDDVDFALVRVDPGVRLDPALAFYGGPTRVGHAPSQATEVYVYTPYGAPGIPNAVSGVAHGGPDYPVVAAAAVGSTTHGAPVIGTDGAAVGYLDGRISLDGGYSLKALGPAMERTQRRAGLRLKLLTARMS